MTLPGASQLRSQLLAQGLPVLPPLAPAEIRFFEAQIGVRFAASFADYLLVMNGVGQRQFDKYLVWFMPIQECRFVSAIGTEIHDASRHRYLAFADYLIGSAEIAIQVDADTDRMAEVVRLGKSGEGIIAPSFEHFLRAYLEDPDVILM